jgi:hypothetical protein
LSAESRRPPGRASTTALAATNSRRFMIASWWGKPGPQRHCCLTPTVELQGIG